MDQNPSKIIEKSIEIVDIESQRERSHTVDFQSSLVYKELINQQRKVHLQTADSKNFEQRSVSIESQGALSKRSTISYHNRVDLSQGRIEQVKPDRALKNKPSKSKEKVK